MLIGLAKEGWVCISLAKSSPEMPNGGIRIPLIDGTGNDKKLLQKVIAWIVARWKEGKKVAVASVLNVTV